jgi:histidyl-tRNA synthetase
LEINSLGQPDERALHRAELIAYLEQHESELDEEAKRRLHSNPLRILDTKNPAMQALVNGAPRLIDFLGATSLAHFDRLKAMLDANRPVSFLEANQQTASALEPACTRWCSACRRLQPTMVNMSHLRASASKMGRASSTWWPSC